MPINTAPYADGIGGVLIVPRVNQTPALIPFCSIKADMWYMVDSQGMYSEVDELIVHF